MAETNRGAIKKASSKIVHLSRVLLAIFGGENDGDVDVDEDLLNNLSQIVKGECVTTYVCVTVCV